MTNQINQIATPSLTLSTMISEAVYKIVVLTEQMVRYFARRNAQEARL